MVSDCSCPNSGSCTTKQSICPRPKASAAWAWFDSLQRVPVPSSPVSSTKTVASVPAPLKSLVYVTTCMSQDLIPVTVQLDPDWQEATALDH